MRNRLTPLLLVLAAIAPAPAHAAVAAPDTATSTQRLLPLADAYVSSAKPNANYGGASKLRTVASPVMRTYIRFNLTAVTTPISQATLMVYSSSRSSKLFELHTVARNDWGERTVTYKTAPTFATTASAVATAPARGWAAVDVTGLVTSGAVLTVALTPRAGVDLTFSSREAGSTAPRLLLETPVSDTMPPSAPASLAVTNVIETSASLTWLPSVDDIGVAGYRLYVDGAASGTATVPSFAFDDLECGRAYVFGVEAYDAAANVSSRAEISSATAACPTSAMPRGIFTNSDADFAQVGSVGFGFVMASAYRENLDRAQAAGVKVLAWLGGYSQDTCSFTWDDEKIRTRVSEVRDHPALLGYFIDDEPHAGPECSNTPAQVRSRSDLVKSLDPGALTVITENRVESFGPLAGAADVMGLVIYPCTLKLVGCDWNKIPERVAAAEAAGVKRYWGVVQTAGDEWYKQPSPAELERLFTQWHATGMEGIFAYTWDCCGEPLQGLRDAPELWSAWRTENGA